MCWTSKGIVKHVANIEHPHRNLSLLPDLVDKLHAACKDCKQVFLNQHPFLPFPPNLSRVEDETRGTGDLDILWIKDESLEDAENLPEPSVLAAEIIENLEAALDQSGG
jgi:hypothetical protein